MGAYLSTPLTDKISTDETNSYLACGASQMQGWRMSQEDAHICSLNFDKNTALFAVFDGHGGSEVAVYCSQKLPDFLKNTETYTKTEFEQALRDAFIGFDATLVKAPVIEELRKLMPAERDGETETEDDGDGEDDEEDLAELCQESHMPLNELLEKYKDSKNNPLANLKRAEAAGGSNSKPHSPILRGRRNGEGSSSSGVVIASAAIAGGSGGSANSADDVVTKPLVLNNGGTVLVTSGSGNPDETGDEAVSSSSTSAAANRQGPINEASSSSITAGSSGSSSSSSNGPSSSCPSQSSNTIKLELDKNNCNSPDSSSANKNLEVQVETPASSTVECSEGKTATKQVANGAASGENEISTNSAKAESVSSSSAGGGVENGVASSNTDKSQSKISSTKSLPSLNDDSDSSSDDDGSYNEKTSDEEEGEVEESEEEEDTDDEEELYPEDEEDDGFLNNMIEGPGSSSGCTAVMALLSGRDLYVANAGDSRCVVCRDGQALDMSLDHKPEDPEELERIRKAGGRVTLDGRVNGGLNLSRAIGDHAYKTNKDLKAEEQMISALPDIKMATITDKDEFMILACDGIWNSMSSEEVVNFVRKRLHSGQNKLSTICEDLFTKCLAPNTMGDGTGCDNMTAVIVQFKPALLEQETTSVNDVTSSSLKRSASPSPDDDINQEAHKRIKTDQETNATAAATVAEPTT